VSGAIILLRGQGFRSGLAAKPEPIGRRRGGAREARGRTQSPARGAASAGSTESQQKCHRAPEQRRGDRAQPRGAGRPHEEARPRRRPLLIRGSQVRILAGASRNRLQTRASGSGRHLRDQARGATDGATRPGRSPRCGRP
jgi:hypothetical protein